jgi:hypothetical protein
VWRVYSAKRMCARAAEADTHTHRAVSRMRGINSCSVQQAWCVVCLPATSHHHHPARVPQESPWEWESQLPEQKKKKPATTASSQPYVPLYVDAAARAGESPYIYRIPRTYPQNPRNPTKDQEMRKHPNPNPKPQTTGTQDPAKLLVGE